MRTPSLKSLMETFKLDRETAALIKELGSLTDKPEELQKLIETTPKLKETADYARSCVNSPWTHPGWRITMALHAMNVLMGTYGVESLTNPNRTFNFNAWPDFEYLNVGDAYSITLVYSRHNGADNLFIGSYGNVVERMRW